MPLPLPNLDDRTYEDILEEVQTLIPGLRPNWTNHNPTDPGIVLIELFSWLTEMILYRVNRVTDASMEKFLKLLNGPNWTLQSELETAIRETIRDLWKRHRAVTKKDFEDLVINEWPRYADDRDLELIQRACCVARCNLELTDPEQRCSSAPEHVSLVIIPETTNITDFPYPSDTLCKEIWHWLDKRRLLTTRHHVVGPDYVDVSITAKLFLKADALENVVLNAAVEKLQDFFHPLTGGHNRKGWPFGRSIYVSEVYEVLEHITGVDYIEKVNLITPEKDRIHLTDEESLVGIKLRTYELIKIDVNKNSFRTQ